MKFRRTDGRSEKEFFGDLPRIRNAPEGLREWLWEIHPAWLAYVDCETGVHNGGRGMHKMVVDNMIKAHETGYFTYVRVPDCERLSGSLQVRAYIETIYGFKK